MKNEVQYLEAARMNADARWTPTGEPPRPDEEMMRREEGETHVDVLLLFEVLYYLMGDGRAEDWRWPARRFVALAGTFAPAVASRLGKAPEMPAAMVGQHHVALDSLKEVWADPTRARRLVEWFGESRWPGPRGLRLSVMRAYFLAREICPEWLGKIQSLEAMAEAFGEPRKGARQRWSWRANELLEGLPHMTWQRTDRQRRHARELAKEHHAKRKAAPNAERIHGGAGLPNQPETPTPLDGASC